MSELNDAVEMLQKLDEKYELTQLKVSGEGKYDEALRITQMRKGIDHCIKVVKRMASGELGVFRTPKGYNPKSIASENTVPPPTPPRFKK